MELNNKVIAITGGASGLGEASTRHFVANGAKVMILDINDDNAKAICDELGDENVKYVNTNICLLYTSPSPRDGLLSRMPSSA